MRAVENRQPRAFDQSPTLALKIRRSLRRRGLRGTIRLALLKGLYRIQGAIFDCRFGVNTSSNVELRDLKIEGPNVVYGIRYQPTPTRLFHEMMGALDVPVSDFTLVDFGCGKGRTLLQAARLGFKRAIGVEFSQGLAAIALANARRVGLKDKVEIVCQDASLFEPPQENCVFYFFLPFLDPVMGVVIQNIKRSLAEHPRQFRIVCYDPPPAGPFENDPAFQTIRRGPEFVVYGPRKAAAAYGLRSAAGVTEIFSSQQS
jgi:SAM-dependent methyltransferase